LEWAVDLGGNDAFITTPIVRSDGVIVGATSRGSVLAIRPDGVIDWQLDVNEGFSHQGSNLGLDGTFYCISSVGTLFAVSRDGKLMWSLRDPDFSGSYRSVLTFSPDGKTLYVPGRGVAVNAIDVSTQMIRWRFGASNQLLLAPMVDSYGNIYVLATDPPMITQPSLISIRPDGTRRWSFSHGNNFDQAFAGDPTIDAEGNIYFGLDTLYSVDWNGNLRWKRSLEVIFPNPFCDVPLVSDAVGRIYAVVGSFANSSYVAVMFNQNGEILGQQLVNTVGYILDSSPAIYWNQEMALAGYKNDRLYLFR
jgi:outer membrane protein assembly factor BamB